MPHSKYHQEFSYYFISQTENSYCPKIQSIVRCRDEQRFLKFICITFSVILQLKESQRNDNRRINTDKIKYFAVVATLTSWRSLKWTTIKEMREQVSNKKDFRL